MIKYRFLIIFCLVLTMSGCAGNNVTVNKDQPDIDLTRKSIALLSVRISNQYKPDRQIELQSVIICPQSELNCKQDLSSNPGSPYKPYKREKDYFNEYLLKYELESGSYNIDGLYTTYRIPTLTSGVGFAKLNLKTEIKPNAIIYLGHLDIVLREKKNNAEISAGGAIPFVDQYIPGFSSGTFDVIVEDKFDEDMKSFISEYPALQKFKVEKSILPQWIRPEKEAVIVAPKVEESVAPKIEEHAIPKEAVVIAPKIEEPVAPKDAVANANVVNIAQVNSNQSDWVIFITGKSGNVASYKKVSTEKGREKFVVKEVFSDKGRKEYIQDRLEKGLSTEGYEKLSSLQSLSEIDCKENKIMNISVSDFDTDGKKLNSHFNDKPKWVKIRNNSFFDSLRKEVCQ